MSLRPISTTDVVRFSPDRYGGRGGTPVYVVGPLPYRDRLWVDMQTLERCGKGVSAEEFREELRTGIGLALEGAEQAAALAALEAYENALEVWRESERTVPVASSNGHVPEDVQRARAVYEAKLAPIARLEDVISRAHRPLARLLRVNHERAGEMAVLYVQAGVRDWSGLPVPCTRSQGRLTDDALNAIPDADLAPLVARIRELCEMSEADRGNFASPSGVSATLTPPSAD